MPIPFIPLLALGAAALLGRRIYQVNKIIDEGADHNTFAKITLEGVECEVKESRREAGRALIELDRTRIQVWAGSMHRFSEFYQWLAGATPENNPLAAMAGTALIDREQQARTAEACHRALGRLAQLAAEEEEFEADFDAWERKEEEKFLKIAPGLSLAPYSPPRLPHDLSCQSVADLASRLLLVSEAERLRELSSENERWADEIDDKFPVSETRANLRAIVEAAKGHQELLEQLPIRLDRILDGLEEKLPTDQAAYPQYCAEHKPQLLSLLRHAKTLIALLEVSLVTKEGKLNPEQQQAADAARELMIEAGNGLA